MVPSTPSFPLHCGAPCYLSTVQGGAGSRFAEIRQQLAATVGTSWDELAAVDPLVRDLARLLDDPRRATAVRESAAVLLLDLTQALRVAGGHPRDPSVSAPADKLV